jgi:hypothetical protein
MTKTWADKFSDFFNFRGKQSGDSKEEEELTPMGFYDMSLFCRYGYLREYKDMIREGRFQQGANIVLDTDRVAHIFLSMSTVSLLRAMSTSGNTIDVDVPTISKFGQVCSFITCCYNFNLITLYACTRDLD